MNANKLQRLMVLALLLALLLGLGLVLALTADPARAAWPFSRKAEPAIEAHKLRHGPFEIVVEGRRVSAGGFPNTSANPFATIEVSSMRVLHAGRMVAVPLPGQGEQGRAGAGPASGDTRFWRVLRLLDAPQPTLLLVLRQFYLLTEQEGRAVVRELGKADTGGPDLQWLDSRQGQPGEISSYGLERLGGVELERGTALQGGRWLKLSWHTVIDVKSLTTYEQQAWIDGGKGLPMEGLNGTAGDTEAIGFSPAQSQYVLRASGAAQGDGGAGLMVMDIATGRAHGLPLLRRVTRYMGTALQIDAAWLAHYYQWERDAQGRERLQLRPSVKPLPWQFRSYFEDQGAGVEFRLEGVNPSAMAQALKAFMWAMPGGAREIDNPSRQQKDGSTFAVAGCPGGVRVSTQMQQRYLGLHGALPAHLEQAAACIPRLRQLVAAFNAELATGRYDSLFSDSAAGER